MILRGNSSGEKNGWADWGTVTVCTVHLSGEIQEVRFVVGTVAVSLAACQEVPERFPGSYF
jgi:hypothetical protein